MRLRGEEEKGERKERRKENRRGGEASGEQAGVLERGTRAGSPFATQRHNSLAAIVPHSAETRKI